MPIEYYLTPELRTRLKQPLGILIRGSFVETMKTLGKVIQDKQPSAVISVGDTVSKNLAKNDFTPQLSIVDNKCMRKSVAPARLAADQTVYVKNPQGTITYEADEAIANALKGTQSVKMVVEGEEDLLALPAILHASNNALVVYGQPYEGIVVVIVTDEKRAEINAILKSMRKTQKAK
jgi:uncharacterized protein (UPF0218 family)